MPYPGRYPWLARLLVIFNDGSEAYCSGSLIAPDTILTAGHCIADANITQVILGA